MSSEKNTGLSPPRVSLSNPSPPLYKSPTPHPPPQKRERESAMAEDEKWVTFDDDDEDDEDDKLSLCDLPVAINDGNQEPKKKQEESDPLEDFEFRTCDGGDFEFRTCGGGLTLKADEPEMCSADEVFSGGQLLPLRPSVSSEWCPSRCGSRSESMDRRSSGFATSRSGSSSSSSGSRSTSSISRSHSSNSFSSAGGDQPSRLSVSNNFYAHPSPTPVLQARRKSTGRRSTGSSPPGWGLFRLGVVKVPEIELYDLRSRQASSKRIDLDAKQEKIAERGHDAKDGNGCQSDAKNEKKVMRFLGRGLGCSCSPDAATQGAVIARKKREEREKPSLKRGESTCRSRVFEWLDELSVSKGSSMG